MPTPEQSIEHVKYYAGLMFASQAQQAAQRGIVSADKACSLLAMLCEPHGIDPDAAAQALKDSIAARADTTTEPIHRIPVQGPMHDCGEL